MVFTPLLKIARNYWYVYPLTWDCTDVLSALLLTFAHIIDGVYPFAWDCTKVLICYPVTWDCTNMLSALLLEIAQMYWYVTLLLEIARMCRDSLVMCFCGTASRQKNQKAHLLAAGAYSYNLQPEIWSVITSIVNNSQQWSHQSITSTVNNSQQWSHQSITSIVNYSQQWSHQSITSIVNNSQQWSHQ